MRKHLASYHVIMNGSGESGGSSSSSSSSRKQQQQQQPLIARVLEEDGLRIEVAVWYFFETETR